MAGGFGIGFMWCQWLGAVGGVCGLLRSVAILHHCLTAKASDGLRHRSAASRERALAHHQFRRFAVFRSRSSRRFLVLFSSLHPPFQLSSRSRMSTHTTSATTTITTHAVVVDKLKQKDTPRTQPLAVALGGGLLSITPAALSRIIRDRPSVTLKEPYDDDLLGHRTRRNRYIFRYQMNTLEIFKRVPDRHCLYTRDFNCNIT